MRASARSARVLCGGMTLQQSDKLAVASSWEVVGWDEEDSGDWKSMSDGVTLF